MTTTTVAGRRARPSHEANPVVYRVLRWIVVGLMHLLYRYRATGQANFPKDGPTMIVVNHLHLFDPGAVVPVTARQIVTLAAGKWQKSFGIRTFLRAAGVVFVKRGEVDRTALRACLDVLSKGRVLAIAPEGTRSRSGVLQRAKPGVAYLATRTNAVIVPMAHWGTERLGEWKQLKRPSCSVVVGRPFRLPTLPERASTAKLQELADLVMVQIGLLLPESYRGVYAERIASVEASMGRDVGVIPV